MYTVLLECGYFTVLTRVCKIIIISLFWPRRTIYHIPVRSLSLCFPYKMERTYLEPEESSPFAILTRCLPQFYFPGLRTEVKPYVVGGLVVSQLMERFQAIQPRGFQEGSWKLDKTFGFYIYKTSFILHYQSVAYLENCEWELYLSQSFLECSTQSSFCKLASNYGNMLFNVISKSLLYPFHHSRRVPKVLWWDREELMPKLNELQPLPPN